jgi:hypothetical protein
VLSSLYLSISDFQYSKETPGANERALSHWNKIKVNFSRRVIFISKNWYIDACRFVKKVFSSCRWEECLVNDSIVSLRGLCMSIYGHSAPLRHDRGVGNCTVTPLDYNCTVTLLGLSNPKIRLTEYSEAHWSWFCSPSYNICLCHRCRSRPTKSTC